MRIAESMSKKETMIREKDFKGAQEWIGAEVLMRSRMVWRLSGRKTDLSCRLVIMSVFEGGVGKESGGREERSRDNGDRERLELGLDEAGEVSEDILRVVCVYILR